MTSFLLLCFSASLARINVTRLVRALTSLVAFILANVLIVLGSIPGSRYVTGSSFSDWFANWEYDTVPLFALIVYRIDTTDLV